MALKLSLLLQAVDRISAPVKRIQESTKRMGEGIQRAGQKIDRAGAPMQRFGAKLNALGGRISATMVKVRHAAGPQGFDLWGKAIDRAGYATGSLIRKVGGLAVGMAKYSAAAAGAAGGFALADMFRTVSQFEQFQVILEGTEGSAGKAKASLAWVQKFAEQTPYELAEVTKAFVDMRNLGLNPMDGSLKALGDGASAMGLPLEQAVAMLGDATTFQFERLREFGITASQENDKVTLNYIKNGKKMSRTVAKDALAVKEAVTGIFSERSGGAMERQSKTMSGIMSNLSDKWKGFLLRVGQAGIFDKVKAGLESILAWVTRLEKSGQLDAWAKGISDGLIEAYNWASKFVNDTNWSEVAAVARDIGWAFWQAAKILAWAVRLATQLATEIKKIGSPLSALTAAFPQIGMVNGLFRAYGALTAPSGDKTNRGARDAVGLNGPKKGLKLPPAPLPRAKVPGATGDGGKVKVGGLIELKVSAAQGTKVAVASMKPDSREIPWSIQIARSNWLPS
jgi:phage tail tape-measure protein